MQVAETADSAAVARQSAEAFFRAHGVKGKIAVAVSGGSDSMALLRLAGDFRDIQPVAVTVDHGLRVASGKEALQVARWCASIGIPHKILRWEGPKPRTAIQARARAARYGLMADWCQDSGVPVLLTGHTMDDQAETVAMRQMRTSSPASLAGIWPETEWNGIRILRPLLGARRRELRQYLLGLGQEWIDDPSNANETFERVRIRKTLREDEISGLAAISNVAQERARQAAASGAQWLRSHATAHPQGFLTLPRGVLAALEREVLLSVLGTAVSTAGSGKRPDRGELVRLADLLEAGTTFRCTLAGALVAARRKEILVCREAGRAQGRPVMIPADGRIRWDGRFDLAAPPGWTVRLAGKDRHVSGPDLPDFVQRALPVLEMGPDRLVFPHFDRIPGVSVTLSERFSL